MHQASHYVYIKEKGAKMDSEGAPVKNRLPV